MNHLAGIAYGIGGLAATIAAAVFLGRAVHRILNGIGRRP